MTRTCQDCPTAISRRSTGRCRHCAAAALNRTPAKRAESSAKMAHRNRLPEFQGKALAGRCARPSWCPAEYAALNRKMEREGFDADERQRIIADDVAARWRRLQGVVAGGGVFA